VHQGLVNGLFESPELFAALDLYVDELDVRIARVPHFDIVATNRLDQCRQLVVSVVARVE
jgi:hypothetical protein